jgi:2,6-dihydroxypseudooxynicotine hydrolase
LSDPRLHHAANWLSRFTVNGVAASDFHDVLSSLTSWDDWCRFWSARAAVHEALGDEALEAKHFVSAAEHLSRAAVTYHFAKYLFVQDMAQMRAAHMKAVDCLNRALPHLDPPGTRVLIPYEGKTLAATFRKPTHVPCPPIVLMTMGLDSTKEEFHTFTPLFLRRGVATLAFDGPGQGEVEFELPLEPIFERLGFPMLANKAA